MTTEFTSHTSTPPARAVRAPSWPLIALAVVTGLAVIAIWPGTTRLPVAALGYGLGALAAPVVTVLHRFGRRKAAKSPFFVRDLRLERLVTVLLVTGILAGLVNAWFVATELAKR